MSSDNNVKREYHMDFDIVEVANAGDEFSIFASFPEMQPSTSAAGFPSRASTSQLPSAAAGFSYGHLIGQMVLDAIEGFLLVVNESAVIDYASQNVCSYTDYAADDLVRRPLYRILHDDDRQLVQPLIDSVAGTATVKSHSSHVTLRLLPNWRPNGALRAGSAPRQPLVLDATLKVQSLANGQPSVSSAPQRYLVCLMKPSLQQQQQQQQMPWPINSSQSMAQSPPTSTAASTASGNSLPPTRPPPSPHSLSDFISCQHSCTESNVVLQAACSSALASKQSVQADFFAGRRWGNLVLPADKAIWQRHVDEVVVGREALSSSIYRCLMTSDGRIAFIKSRSYLCEQQPGQFKSTHCIIRFCDTEADLDGSPSASLLRRVGSGSGSNDSLSAPPQQQLPPPRAALGPRERQELLSLGALYKSCAKQDPERAAALRNRMLTLWADSQHQQHHHQQQQQQVTLAVQTLPSSQPPAQPLFLSSLPRTPVAASSLTSVATNGRQPASLLMELLNGPSTHSCAVSLTTGTLQDLLNAKESQARMAEQQQVSSTTATPSTPGRKRQPSWPDNLGAPDGGEGADSNSQFGSKRKPPPGGTQLLAALLSDSAAAGSASSVAAVPTREPVPMAAKAGVSHANGGEEMGVLDSVLRSIDELKQQQQQQRLPPVTLALIQQPPLPHPPPPPSQHRPLPALDVGGSGELPEDVVLDIILDMEERHKQPVPDSTTPGSGRSGGLAVGVSPSASAGSNNGGSTGGGTASGGGGGLLERLLSS